MPPHSSAKKDVDILLGQLYPTTNSIESKDEKSSDQIDEKSDRVDKQKKQKTEEKEYNIVVAVRQGNILATAFHPELTEDLRWHR